MKNYETTDKKTWINHKILARENRKNPTFAEKLIWNMLRKEQLGAKFRRQQVIDKYIVDFISLPIKLIIEIDRNSHIGKEEYDQNRQEHLENLGYKVIRFTNEEFLGNGNNVEQTIKNEITKRQTPPKSSPKGRT